MLRGDKASWVDRLLFGLLFFFIVATLGQALVGGVTLLDVNILSRFQPWQALHGTNINTTNICRGDTVDAVMPGIAEIRRRIFSGDYPGWSPFASGGAPLGGAPNLGQFGPLALPYYVLPLWLAPAFVKLGEFAVAVAGMVLFLRRLKLSAASGILAGIVFASSGFMISWTNWPQTRVTAFIPALFWATERLAQERRLKDCLPLAAVMASMLLGGFPAVTGIALYAAGGYFVIRVFILCQRQLRELLRGFGSAIAGLVLGTGLTAFQLLPFTKELSSVNLDYRAQTPDAHSSLSSLITAISPNAQGLCIAGKSYSVDNPVENVIFLGAAACVLAVAAIAWPQRTTSYSRGVVGFLAAATVVAIALGWFGGKPLELVQHLPVFSNNSITRVRSLLGFSVAALAGFGFERMIRALRDREDGDEMPGGNLMRILSLRGVAAGWAVLVALAAVAFGLKVFLAARADSLSGHAYVRLRHLLTGPWVLIALAVIGLLCMRFGPTWSRYVAVCTLPLLVVGQSVSFTKTELAGSDPALFYPVTSTHQFLKDNLGGERYVSTSQRMYSATSSYYGLRTVTGHEFTTDGWKSLLSQIDPAVMASATFSEFSDKAINAGNAGNSPMLDELAVKYFVAADSDISGVKTPPSGATSVQELAAKQVGNCSVQPGHLRGLALHLASPVVGSGRKGATVHVRVHSSSGSVTGARYLGGGASVPTTIVVGVPGEDFGGAVPLTAEVWFSGTAVPVKLDASSTGLTCGTVRGTDDGLKLVHSDAGAVVYQRLKSQPRIRWAAKATVEPDAQTRLTKLTSGIGADTVLLNSAGPTADGKGAQADVLRDSGDDVSVRVRAAGAGYLVVADSMQQPGWTATVDGKPVPLLPADHALVAVAVPAGDHQVHLRYSVPGLGTGALVSLGSSLVVAAILLTWWLRRRRRSAAKPAPAVR